MPLTRSRWPHPFLLLLILPGAVVTAFGSAIFYIGTQEKLARLAQTEGLPLLFAKRFLGFAVFGCLLAAGTALLSWLGHRFGFGRDWAPPRRVFWLTLGLQLVCALVGCLIFTWAAYQAGSGQ